MGTKAELEKVLGHQFSDISLLETALTHPSVSGQHNYQRLEFLGDRILGATIADLLYHQYPDMNEGDMALRFNDLVRRETLSRVATQIGVGSFIHLSPGEDDSGGRDKPAILADVCEAIIGALYLDGGQESAQRFIHTNWNELVTDAKSTQKDGKTALQEWAQGNGLETPSYDEIDRTGPSHAPIFTIEVRLNNGMTAIGVGRSKRSAEQDAADNLYKLI
jgi:ribonuclease-3